MYGANSSKRVLKTALGEASFTQARSPGRRASPGFSAPAFQDSPLSFVPLPPTFGYVSAPAGKPGSPQSAPRRVCTRGSEQRRPLPGWEIHGRPCPGEDRAASVRPLRRSRRRQESAGVTPASRRPRRRRRPWRSAQRVPANRSTEGGRLLGPLIGGIGGEAVLFSAWALKILAAGSSSLVNPLRIPGGMCGVARRQGDPAWPLNLHTKRC